MNTNIQHTLTKGMINPYIFQIKSQNENPINTNIIPDTDFSISISCDTEFINIRDENGRDKKLYICGQFKETNQLYSSLHIHPDMNSPKYQDKIPCKYTHNIKFNRDLVENKIVDYSFKDNSKSLLQHELKRLTGKDFVIIPKKIKRSENITSLNKKKLPVMTIKLYMFFGLVDYRGILGYDGDNLIVNTLDYYHTRKTNKLSYRKYLNTGINGRSYLPFNNLIFRIKNNDGTFQDCLFNLEIIDIFASLGPTSYLKYSKLVDHNLEFKDILTTDDKRDMLTFMANNPDDFLNYSLGDCESESMFKKYCSKLKDICQVLGINYKKPKLSLGGTVASILSSFIEKKTGLSRKDLENYLNFTAKKLKQFRGDTSILNSLIYGGRCISNNGRVTLLNLSILIDIDLDGAYNNILNCLGLKFFVCEGLPEIYSVPIDNPKQLKNIRQYPEIIDRCMSLGEYLKKHQSNFVPFGYQIIVISDTDNMKYSQDFFISKYNYQIKNVDNIDTLVEKTDETKSFTNELHVSMFAHTSLQLFLNDPNKDFVRYMLNHLKVLTASYYHKDKQVNDVCELSDDKWLSVPINELSSKIQSLRKIYPKGTPENNLYKLIANTIYGVLASPWFDTSNPITANSITDAIRTACYIVEKKVNGVKSITDGCQIDINNIIVNRHENQNSMTMSNLVGVNYLTDRELNQRNLKRQSLINGKWKITTIDVDILDKNTDDYVFKGISENDLNSIEILTNYDVIYNYGLIDENTNKLYDKKQINQLILDYCFQDYQDYLPICTEMRKSGNPITKGSQENFLHNHNGIDYYLNPVEIKGLVGIEIKNIYTVGVFHSSANYMLQTLHGKKVVAYRSIKAKGYQQVTENNDFRLTVDIDSPRNTFFDSIANNPCAVTRSEIYYKSDILTPTMYSHHQDKLSYLGYSIGENIPMVGYLKEFSYTSFLYRNFTEYTLVKNECEKLKRNYGQSYEMFFINSDNTLNIDRMIETISSLVSRGLDGRSIYSYLSSKIKITDDKKYHPQFHRLKLLKNKLLEKWITKNDTKNNIVTDFDFDLDNVEFWDNDSKSEYLDNHTENYHDDFSINFDGEFNPDF